jgi:hypothetical protein
VGRKQLVAVLVVVVAVAIAVAVAAASRGGAKQPKPAARPAVLNGLGDDDANVMRRLQRKNLLRSHP